MPVRRLDPYQLGSVVRLRPSSGRTRLVVKAPSGLELKAPLDKGGYVDLWLPQVGTWTYYWEGDRGPEQTLEVAEVDDVLDELVDAVPELVQPAPPMAITRHPRR